jgi:hypothetical protein
MKDLYKGDKGNIGALKWGHEVIAWEAPDPTKTGIHQPIVSTLGIHTVQPRVRSCLVLWKAHDLNKVNVPPGRGQSCSCGKRPANHVKSELHVLKLSPLWDSKMF